MASRIEELQAEVLAAEAEARASALTEEEAAEFALLARRQEAKEALAAAARARRAGRLVAAERAARGRVPARVLVKGVDLVDLFPLGVAPDEKALPGEGVIVVRSATPEALKTFHREAEAKEKPLADLYADMLCECTVEPDVAKDQNAGALLRAFCEAYPGAAIGAGEVAVRLGGSKIKADKRGRG